MNIHEDHSENLTIQSYSEDSVTIAGETYRHNIVVTATSVIPWITDATQLIISDFNIIVEQQPEIIILGHNIKNFSLPQEIQAKLQQSFGLEVMLFDAACRTFTILMAEKRNALLGLLLV